MRYLLQFTTGIYSLFYIAIILPLGIIAIVSLLIFAFTMLLIDSGWDLQKELSRRSIEAFKRTGQSRV